MVKREDSLRSLGMTTVAVERSLRDDINSLASARGLKAVEYLRLKVAEDKSKTPQGVMASMPPVSTVHSVEAKLDKIMSSPLMQMLMSEDAMTGEQTTRMYADIAKACVNAVKDLRANKQGELHLA